jgi:hypothetical protein
LGVDDWLHLTGTFTYGSGDSKAELDEIICRSVEMWGGMLVPPSLHPKPSSKPKKPRPSA